jgi:hypothetical protein
MMMRGKNNLMSLAQRELVAGDVPASTREPLSSDQLQSLWYRRQYCYVAEIAELRSSSSYLRQVYHLV